MLINVHDFERVAAQRLSQPAYDYYRGGARDEISLRRNRQAYSDYAVLYKVLADVSAIDLSTSVLGMPVSMPILAAPTAFHGMADVGAEAASARAVTGEGSIFILSTLSNTPMEKVIQEASGPVLFQLYIYKDRGVTRELVQRAQAAGARALVVTVDAPVLAIREKDTHNRFTLPPGLTLANLSGTGKETLEGGGLDSYVQRQLDPSLSMRDLEWLVAETSLPVVVKGVVRADDAVRCAQLGARAIVVSNHGGRQLDHSPATLHCVERVRQALDPSVEVWMDGGIRRGAEAMLALCLGARVVLVGRPLLWGLAAAGEEGVRQVFRTLRAELNEAMLLTGCSQLQQLSRDLVERVS
ncbi:alpha-hydroxy-acid oxidizing protein [bacterium]|nr:alpha-hydroxy-acid oxidizing protein [bacterium]